MLGYRIVGTVSLHALLRIRSRGLVSRMATRVVKLQTAENGQSAFTSGHASASLFASVTHRNYFHALESWHID